MTADSLAAFLEARFKEIVKAVEDALASPYYANKPPFGGLFEPASDSPESRAEFYLAVDPAYVLADIEAKRRIVAWHTNDHDLLHSSRPTVGCRCYDGWPCTTLRLLAQPFADHPDFDPRWKRGK